MSRYQKTLQVCPPASAFSDVGGQTRYEEVRKDITSAAAGLPIFALSHLSETLQKLCLCRGVVPLYFDAEAFDQDSVDGRAIEFLLDGGYLRKGDSIILTKGAIMGTAGSTNIMKILPVD